jgi:carboxynorspermidine decarboxylase
MDLAILDTSATCHMPDTLEMPYRAEIFDITAKENAGEKGEKQHSYRLGGQTCLAGDVMGDYSFDQPLEIGQRLMFDDMSHYTMVKTSTFNGIGLPSLALWNSETDEVTVVKQFGYQDFKQRLS